MATRRDRVVRRDGRIVVVIDSIEHTMSEPGFVALMASALAVLESLAREKAINDRH